MHFYGLIIGISLLIGIEYFSRHQQVIPKNKENLFLFLLLISMLLGARLYHVIDQWSYYSEHLSQIFSTWNGGLGIYGALIAGGLYITIYSLISKISFFSIIDSITPILPLCQAIGRFGNYINHEIPIWWLEALLNLILFFSINSKKLKKYSPTSLYLIGYGLIRFIVEFYRNDTWLYQGIKIAQLISVISIFIGLYLLRKNSRIRH